MLKLSVAVCVFIVAVVNGDSFDRGIIRIIPDGRIVGGQPTIIQQFPWQVSMTFLSVHRCGGSIISIDRVLTAAHCTSGVPTSLIGIRFGSSFRTDGGTHTSIDQFIQHPEYDMPTAVNNDISIIIMPILFSYGPFVQPINLPYQDERISDGAIGLVSGWGATYESGSTSDQLQFVAVPKIDQSTCVAAYASINRVTDAMICFGFLHSGQHDACQGDSGGPLIVGNKLQGIVSWGYGCARSEYPGIYTRVSHFIDWLVSV